ncbi:MAG TPA: hypothetical protein PKN75_03100 [Bacteroidia bacterium]|nr:hypothetical protein [Bacteroidia bacterium]HNU32555.1 hypothetical protein [Bacteroidia bacterium]
MKRIFIFSIALCAFVTVKAQDYKTAAGVRFGASNGITLKHFIKDDAALEGILAFRYRGFNFTGLYEKHFSNAFKVNRLNWYIGAGGNIGVIDRDRYRWYDEKDEGTALLLGIDGIIGIEYNFQEVPLNVSLDWKPMINLTGVYFWGDEVGLSIRYTF